MPVMASHRSAHNLIIFDHGQHRRVGFAQSPSSVSERIIPRTSQPGGFPQVNSLVEVFLAQLGNLHQPSITALLADSDGRPNQCIA
ncbi:MAG: hypothetical protein ACTJF3_11780, partial [Glutamicibacter arilaitensis]